RIAESAGLRRSPTPNTLLEVPMRETTSLAPCEPVKSATTPLRYLTPKQVADLLQVNERTVLRWAQQDPSIPTIRIGKVIRFEREPLMRWLARKRPRSGARTAQERVSAA